MIKDTMREQNTQFSTNLKEIHGHMLTELETVRHKVNDVDSYAENLKLTMGDQDIKVAELKIRIDSTENKLIQLDQARVKLESGKTDVIDFQNLKQYTEECIHKLQVANSKTKDHCDSLDHYLDKYQPVRMQNAISAALSASLTGEQRRKHELHDNDILSRLYKQILSEDEEERAGIMDQIHKLNEAAKTAIGLEEANARKEAKANAEKEALMGGDDEEDVNQTQNVSPAL